MSDIRDLIRIYEIEGAEREEIEELAVRCRVRPWWREYGEIFDNEFPGYENDASRHPGLHAAGAARPAADPGLHGGFSTGPRPPAWRRKARATRLRRQEILDRTDGTAPTPDRR